MRSVATKSAPILCCTLYLHRNHLSSRGSQQCMTLSNITDSTMRPCLLSPFPHVRNCTAQLAYKSDIQNTTSI